jgi:4-hydroxy-3-polyprenylbenzoate decarboxylase
VAFTIAGEIKRELWKELSIDFSLPRGFENCKMVMPGVLAIESPKYLDDETTLKEIAVLNQHLNVLDLSGLPLIILCDDAHFTATTMNNFVWITFTRSNPSHDIHGVNSFTEHKHWGCKGPLIIDARIKPHHAPPLILDSKVEEKIAYLGKKGGSLYGII